MLPAPQRAQVAAWVADGTGSKSRALRRRGRRSAPFADFVTFCSLFGRVGGTKFVTSLKPPIHPPFFCIGQLDVLRFAGKKRNIMFVGPHLLGNYIKHDNNRDEQKITTFATNKTKNTNNKHAEYDLVSRSPGTRTWQAPRREI